MEGEHDPLLATCLLIDNGEKAIALCGVDHLGFTFQMTQDVQYRVRRHPGLERCEVYIGSSHTHSGGGAFLEIPEIGPSLAGAYDTHITDLYVTAVIKAIVAARQSAQPAKLGIGYGHLPDAHRYRSRFPRGITPPDDLMVIKATTVDDQPLAVFFNYAVHPTVLPASNLLFSADFVGYARHHLRHLLGEQVQPVYFNGAQAELVPPASQQPPFEACERLGHEMADAVYALWEHISTHDSLEMDSIKKPYCFVPQPTPEGLKLPLEHYMTELNVIVLGRKHALIGVPGELSCVYDARLKEAASGLGYEHLSVLGLCNDAHGYIILPDAWGYPTYEASLSFGGQSYGEQVYSQIHSLLEQCMQQVR